ncbi:MAG TPA: STAS domain-containing protein [Isosphaeraceae bacterium]|jgi:anti-sigma B factor antagonist
MERADASPMDPAKARTSEPRGREYLKVDLIDGTAVVRFVGTDIVYAEEIVRDVGDQLDRLVDTEGHTQILLNLSGIRYLSSTMLGRLVSVNRRLEKAGGRLKLCCLSPVVSDIFRISRLDQVFQIFEDEEHALKNRPRPAPNDEAAPGHCSGAGSDRA